MDIQKLHGMISWSRTSGLRWPLLARLTNGRYGLGIWTQEELDRVRAAAALNAEEFKKYYD